MSQHHTGQGGLSSGAQGAAGIEGWQRSGRSWPNIYPKRWAQPCQVGMAGAGGWPQHCVAHLASSSLTCRVARPHDVASIAGEDASLVFLFLSAFSHLPPPLGSASWRWVDGRLSGDAASPTASPAWLTKPAQEMLPFWAERFSLQAQFRGKSLVFRDSSEHPLSSAHSGSRGELAGSHGEAALIAAPISKPQAAIPSPAVRNHEGISVLSSQGQHGPFPFTWSPVGSNSPVLRQEKHPRACG